MLASAPVTAVRTLSAGAAVRTHVLQRAVRAANPRVFVPEAKVPSFQRVPGLHGNVAVVKSSVADAEPRRQSLLPDAGGQDQDGARDGASVVVPRDGPQPVVERPAP